MTIVCMTLRGGWERIDYLGTKGNIFLGNGIILHLVFFGGEYIMLYIYQNSVNSKVKIAIFIYIKYMLSWLTDK